MLSLMLRSLFWATWWPASTWLLAMERMGEQATEAFRAGVESELAEFQRERAEAAEPAKPGRSESKNSEEIMSEAFTKMEMPEPLRGLMKMGIEQARYAFETFAATSEKALKSFETSSASARESLLSLNEKIAEISRKNAEANFALAMKLAEAKDVNQAMAMQSEHMKAQIASFTAQMEEFRDLAAKVIQENAAKAPQAPFPGSPQPNPYGPRGE